MTMPRTNRPSPIIFGLVLVILLVMATIWIMLSGGSDRETTGTTSPFGNASAPPTPVPSSLPAAPTPTPTSRSPVPLPPIDTASIAPKLQGFIQDFYLLKPDDTEAIRTARVQQYLTNAFSSQLDLSVSTDSEADNARIQNGLTVTAVADIALMQAQSENTDGTEATVVAPVTIAVRSRDDAVINQRSMLTTSLWQLFGEDWQMIAFGEGGEPEDG